VISIFLVAATIATASGGQAIQRTTWEDYASKEGKFSVRFPGKPKETKQTTKSQIGEVEVYTTAYVTNDGVVYMVSYSDLPASATKPENLSTLFDGVREGAKDKDGLVRRDDSIEFGPNKLPAHELYLRKGDQLLKLKAIVRDNRLYQVWVVGKYVDKEEKFDKNTNASEFLSSFLLTK
jgi:hypothetical protein